MRKKQYLWTAAAVVLAAMALTACSGKEASGTAAGNETVLETSEDASGEKESAGETDAGEEPKEDNAGETKAQESGASQGTLPGNEAWKQLDVELSGEYDGEWQDGKAIIRSECDTVIVLDDGYEQLKQALAEYNENNCQEVKTIYEENREWAMEEQELFRDIECYITRKIEFMRADGQILSFWNKEGSYLGGAHDNYYMSGENFDPETGEQLTLTDVVTDYKAVYDYVKADLENNYDQGMFFEGYKDTLEGMFFGSDDDGMMPLEWTMDGEGLTMFFNPYVLTPWAGGGVTVKIPFEGNEDLFVDVYGRTPRQPARRVYKGENFSVTWNGTERTLRFTADYNEGTYDTTVRITLVEENDETWRENTYYGSFCDAWLMEAPDGHPYLYAEFLSENDWRSLEVFDLADEKKFMPSVSGLGDSFYGHFVADSEDFALYTRLDTLGTYMVYRRYSVGEDGMPKPKETAYRLTSAAKEDGFKLVSKRELPVTILEDGAESKETLPAGTSFILKATDGETFVEAELSDGRRCRIELEMREEWPHYYIDGISEEDCFEDLWYAG